MIFAGTPAITTLSGNDLLTTAPAPIVTLLPIVIGPNILTPGPIYTLSPIVGTPSSVPPILTQTCIRQLLPIRAFLFTTKVPYCAKQTPGPKLFLYIV